MADNMVEFKLTINKDYAKKLHKQKEKAELDSLKQKYGDVDISNEEESSSSESEDEDARELTAQKEKDFLTVLSLIKRNDPKLYSKEAHFYHSEDEESLDEKREKKKKPMYLKDYERKELIEKESKAFISDDEENAEESFTRNTKKESITYNEEQKALRDSFKDAIGDSDEEDEEFLKVRVKTEEENKEEENAYIEWLKGEKERMNSQETQDMETLRRFWTDPQLDDDEKFLRDFVLNKDYIDKDNDRIPTYDEIIAEENDAEDEEEIEKQEEFERKYNFRFEEPDSELIKSYPRTVGGSVRRMDDRRKAKRKSREERKKQEKEKKREELKRLKNLKKKEIMEKLERLKEITGNPNVGFNEDDLEGDFDPTQYDQAMQKVFDEQYYADGQVDDGKPVFEDDLGEIDEEPNWDEWEGDGYAGEAHGIETNNYELHCEDPNFNMDADYEEDYQNEKPTGKKRKRGSRLAQALRKQKPTFNPDEKTFEEYFDEYYKLDYEDLIGDLPCRFKYRSVVPNDFGLSTDEILKCPDKELNQWVSVKRAVQYRSEVDERRDIKKYRKKSRDYKHKLRILASLDEHESTNDTKEDLQNCGDKTKKKRNKNIGNAKDGNEQLKPTAAKENITKTDQRTLSSTDDTNKPTTTISTTKTIRNRKKWRRMPSSKELKEAAVKKRLALRFRGANRKHVTKLSAGRLAAFGLDKKKKKRK